MNKKLPNGWKEVRLGEVCQEIKEKNKGKTNLVLSISNKYGFIKPEEQFPKQVASDDISNYKICYRNNFAYNPARINVGSIAILLKFDICAVSPMYVVFNVQDSRLNVNYFNHILQTSKIKQFFINNNKGSVRNNISYETFSKFNLSLPPLETQKEIASSLNKINGIAFRKRQYKYYLNKLLDYKNYE